MPYEYLEDEAIADIAFKAWGESGHSIYNRHGEFKMIAFEKKE